MHDPNCNDPSCPGLPDPGPPPVEIILSCGHELKLPPEKLFIVLDYVLRGAVGGPGATLDCPECKTLQMMLPKKMIIHTFDFHKWMHERDPEWPEDGVGTGYFEGPIPKAHNPRHN